MFERGLKCLGWPVGRVGLFEVGQYVGGSLLQRAAQGDGFGECLRDAAAEVGGQFVHQFTATAPVLNPVKSSIATTLTGLWKAPSRSAS